MLNRKSAETEGSAFSEETTHTTLDCERISIFAYGPWYTPNRNRRISARYIIGRSKDGYHWDTEFSAVNLENHSDLKTGVISNHHFHWSPPCTFVDLAIKHARRCIAIQAHNIDLDTHSKIAFSLPDGTQSEVDIHKVHLNKNLVYVLDKKDLHRIAIYNGYLSWSEFENGYLDFSRI